MDEVENVVNELLLVEGRYLDQLESSIKSTMRELKPFYDKLLDIPPTLSDKVKKLRDDVEKIPTIEARFKVNFGKHPKGVSFSMVEKDSVSIPAVKIDGSSSDKLTPLTVKQTTSLVKLAVKLADLRYEWDDTFKLYNTMGFFSEEELPTAWQKLDDDVMDKLWKVMPFRLTREFYGPSTYTLDGIDAFNNARSAMYKAILIWINRSFK